MADLNKMLKEIRERTSPEEKKFIRKNMAIVDSVFEVLERKKMKASDLARKMEKSPAEVSKWLSGSHNLTLHSIVKMESALGEDLIYTASEAKKQYEAVKYITLTVEANANAGPNISYKNQSKWCCLRNIVSVPKSA